MSEETKKKTTRKKKVEDIKPEIVETVDKVTKPKKTEKVKAENVEDKKENKKVSLKPKAEKTAKKKNNSSKKENQNKTEEHKENKIVEIKENNQEEIKTEEKKEAPKEETKVVQPVASVPPAKENINSITVDRSTIKSEFDGKLLQLIGWYLLGCLVSIITLGLGAPFAKCFILNWQYKHTKINGRRLCFDGNGFQLLGNYIKWSFFIVITLGIYLIFLPVAWNKWVVKHTHYEGNKKPVVNYSLFDGTTWDLIGLSILSFFLNLFSFGLLIPFTNNLLLSWKINHTTYDTIDMEFDGKGFQLLGNYIKWTFFSIITLGIYSLWIPIKKIKWEVKHTNEKGFSKHPYKPVLGMVLPIILCILFIVGGVFGLTRIDRNTLKDWVNDVNHFANSINKENKRYDLAHVLVERGADMIYRIQTKDINITWEERYDRFFNPSWYDKFSENKYDDEIKGQVEMTLLDVEDIKEPVLFIKNEDTYNIYWLYEKKIESHHYITKDEMSGLYLATDDSGIEHIAIVEKGDEEFYHLNYIKDTVNYNDNDIVYALEYESFVERINNKGIKLEKLDINYTNVNLDNMDGFDNMVKNYYNHTDKKYETIPEPVITDYKDEYIAYLDEHANGEYTVGILDNTVSPNLVLVVFENNKSYILNYDEEIKPYSINKKGYLGILQNNSSNKQENVIVVIDGKNRIYYFINSMINENSKTLKIKNKNIIKELNKKGYKEITNQIELISITNKEDLNNLKEILKNK